MRLQQAVGRLKWRLEKCASFRPNKKDLEAFNALVEWLNNSQQQTWNNQQVTAKLYLVELKEQQNKYELEITDPRLSAKVNKHLAKPLFFLIDQYKDFLNNREMEKVADQIKAEGGPRSLTDERAEHFRGEMRKAGERFSYEEVELNIRQMVTEALRKYS